LVQTRNIVNQLKPTPDNRISNYPAELTYQIKSFEKIPVNIFSDSVQGSQHIARLIANAIIDKQNRGEDIVLGLATGSSPIKLYTELIRLHRDEGLSFKNVITFNLDEYYPMHADQIQSYHLFMNEHLFNHIDIPVDNINIPSGSLTLDEVEQYCKDYERKIEILGGLDIQILGIGRTGHIGFNEPGSTLNSLTRLVRLDNLTRLDAAQDFNGVLNVPYKAITMGVKTILNAKQIYIMAWGQHKADIVQEAVEGSPSSDVPATFLQDHDKVRFYVDKAAADKLTRVQHPWKVGNCEWTDDLICRAVVWLSQKINKPILKLTNEDYNEHGLSELLLKVSDAYQLNIRIFNRLQHTITGWPGGKPNTEDTHRPERALPAQKRVIIFSPHPDDDVISMGGTFSRLVEQGHDVHVAYQTSGNIAVHDHDVLRFIEFLEEFNSEHGWEKPLNIDKIKAELNTGVNNQNTEAIKKIKGLIRRGEARAAARFVGLKDENIHFMDLPFYETGSIKKKEMGDADISMTHELLQKIQPHQIFAAGDLADPHGTHRVCLNVILLALEGSKDASWSDECWLWLYRGAWQEFRIDEIEMAVPLSPEELLKKRKAIFMHQSQKDSAPFPGGDEREFWQRAEQRNKHTAKSYRNLGFAEYEAIEAFKRWHF